MTDAQAKEIERTGIIPNELLDEYLADKLLEKPKLKGWDKLVAQEAEDDRFQTMYNAYKANMKAAQKASNAQLKGRR